jgi:hypothetical protein
VPKVGERHTEKDHLAARQPQRRETKESLLLTLLLRSDKLVTPLPTVMPGRWEEEVGNFPSQYPKNV